MLIGGIVQKELAERTEASQAGQVIPEQTPTDIKTVFKDVKNPVMVGFAKWWKLLQEKEEGPLLPARSFNQAIDQILSAIEGLVHEWETDIAPTLVAQRVEVAPQEEAGVVGGRELRRRKE